MGKTKTTTTDNGTEIQILEVLQGEIDFCILGTSPLIYNAMSEKVRHELLMPTGRSGRKGNGRSWTGAAWNGRIGKVRHYAERGGLDGNGWVWNSRK